jgi:hypothetical protein
MTCKLYIIIYTFSHHLLTCYSDTYGLNLHYIKDTERLKECDLFYQNRIINSTLKDFHTTEKYILLQYDIYLEIILSQGLIK